MWRQAGSSFAVRHSWPGPSMGNRERGRGGAALRKLGKRQPLIAPNASPRTRWRCNAIMKTTIGSMMPIAAAADNDQ